jgi:hypothetical protein
MELILLLAAIAITLAIVTWLVKVVKATLSTAIAIAIIVFTIQIIWGIGPGELWESITQFWLNLGRSLSGGA